MGLPGNTAPAKLYGSAAGAMNVASGRLASVSALIRPSRSGSLAMLAAMRRASSRVEGNRLKGSALDTSTTMR
jgi:hypothetical protein